jgi:type I restriction enzyme, S subunit
LGDFCELAKCKFARRVGAVEKLKAAQRTALAEQDALFATLQHRAFRGEL